MNRLPNDDKDLAEVRAKMKKQATTPREQELVDMAIAHCQLDQLRDNYDFLMEIARSMLSKLHDVQLGAIMALLADSGLDAKQTLKILHEEIPVPICQMVLSAALITLRTEAEARRLRK
jgi:SOS response regulatory protein OraA/RecX